MPLYCWDTSVFIAWLNRQISAPLAEIDAILDDIYAGRVTLMVPVMVYTEIVRAKHSAEQILSFDRFLDRSNVQVIEQSLAVAREAEKIRSRGITMSVDGGRVAKRQERKIKAPDAAIIATAILYGADVLHSLEPKHLQLNGSPIVAGLKITKPIGPGGQQSLTMER